MSTTNHLPDDQESNEEVPYCTEDSDCGSACQILKIAAYVIGAIVAIILIALFTSI